MIGKARMPKSQKHDINYLTKILFCKFFVHFQCVRAQEHITEIACNSATRPAIVTGLRAVLLSPGYPGHYDDNESCEWIMRPGAGTTVHQFLSRFFRFDKISKRELAALYEVSAPHPRKILDLPLQDDTFFICWITFQIFLRLAIAKKFDMVKYIICCFFYFYFFIEIS